MDLLLQINCSLFGTSRGRAIMNELQKLEKILDLRFTNEKNYAYSINSFIMWELLKVQDCMYGLKKSK